MSDLEGEAEASGTKRQHDGEAEKSASEDEEWIGPLPTEAAPAKKRKGKIAVNGVRRDFSTNIFVLFGQFWSTRSSIWRIYQMPIATRKVICIAMSSHTSL